MGERLSLSLRTLRLLAVTAPFRGGYRYGYDAYDYYDGGRTYDDSYTYYQTRPVYPRTTCGLQPGATYLGPDGRWYPC